MLLFNSLHIKPFKERNRFGEIVGPRSHNGGVGDTLDGHISRGGIGVQGNNPIGVENGKHLIHRIVFVVAAELLDERWTLVEQQFARVNSQPTFLSYYTSLILLNVADHEDTTYHIEKSHTV